jgi:chromosome segregation ATPase
MAFSAKGEIEQFKAGLQKDIFSFKCALDELFKIVVYTNFNFCFTMTTMFDDLDHLAQRILQLAKRMQAQNHTIDQLNQSVAELRADRDALVANLKLQNEKLMNAEVALQSTQSQSQISAQQALSEQQQLQGTLDLFKQEHVTLQKQASSTSEQLGRLREVNHAAQQRINRVLEQLPGATPAEPA